MENINRVKTRINYLTEVTERCNKVKLPLAITSLIGLSSSAVLASLYATPYVGEVLNTATVTVGSLSAVSLGIYFMAVKLSSMSEDEIFELEEKYYLELQKDDFMEKVSSYTR